MITTAFWVVPLIQEALPDGGGGGPGGSVLLCAELRADADGGQRRPAHGRDPPGGLGLRHQVQGAGETLQRIRHFLWKPVDFVLQMTFNHLRPKKSWCKYGRTSGDTWRPHWVAVDTACVCSIRKKRLMSLDTGRAPLTGKNFLP
ncbi:hypothetical protein AVEN_65010-1 [Araneus ventricosus]|uniref:Uncharacterized protein n=1 Tax=Araneus ventricosus TaxID=182803 RepID=A0A4Y2UE63_ARAVE|nr:hypothetical protein AVEN_65010-1 [Araneus ventricosus]